MKRNGMPSWLQNRKYRRSRLNTIKDNESKYDDSSTDHKTNNEPGRSQSNDVAASKHMLDNKMIDKYYQDNNLTPPRQVDYSNLSVPERLRKVRIANPDEPATALYLDEFLKISREKMESYKKNLPNKESIYEVRTEFLQPEEKIQYMKLKKSHSSMEKQEQLNKYTKIMKKMIAIKKKEK